jgi:hypothetical protein
MAISEIYSGTELVTTAEHYLTSDTTSIQAITTDGIFQLWLDVNDMIAGDILQIRIYEKCKGGSPGDIQRVAAEWILRDAQSSPLWVSPSLILMHGWDMSLDVLAGTNVRVHWSIRSVA